MNETIAITDNLIPPAKTITINSIAIPLAFIQILAITELRTLYAIPKN